MKKKFKIILSAITIPAIAATPLLTLVNANKQQETNSKISNQSSSLITNKQIEGEETPKNTGDGSGGNGGEGGSGTNPSNGNNDDVVVVPVPKPKPTLSPEFNSFKEIVLQGFQKNMKALIESTIIRFEVEVSKLKEDEDEATFKTRIEKILYFRKIIKFLKENKENFINKPKDVGTDPILLNLIANNKNFNFGTISFNGEKFDDIGYSADDKATDYSSILSKDDPSIAPRKDNPTSINGTDRAKLEGLISTYFNALRTELSKFIYSGDEDVPKIYKDVILDIDKKEDTVGNQEQPEETPKEGIDIKIPEGYTSWNEYFIKKIRPKFIRFDLFQNQEFFREEQKDPPSEPVDPPKPPLPPPITEPTEGELPLVPEEPIVETDVPIQRVALLKPILLPQFSTLSIEEIREKFNNNQNAENKEELFYFDNPVNTRFDYQVQSLRIHEDQLLATIKLVDKNTIPNEAEPNKKESLRIYNEYIEAPQSEEYKKKNTIKFALYNEAKNLFVEFYTALGLDEKINYNALKNKTLQDGVFSMVNLAYEAVNTPEFLKHKDKIIETYASALSTNDEQKTTKGASQEYKINILNILANSKIKLQDDLSYWYFLADRYKSVVRDFYNLMFQNKTSFEEKIIENKMDVNKINDLYVHLKKEVAKLEAIALVQVASLNKDVDYHKLTKNLTRITTASKTLSTIFNNLNKKEDQEADTVRTTNLQIAYDQANEILDKANKPNKTFLKAIGSILIILSLLSIIAGMLFWILRSKKIKGHKKLQKILIILLATSLVILAIGIALLSVGI